MDADIAQRELPATASDLSEALRAPAAVVEHGTRIPTDTYALELTFGELHVPGDTTDAYVMYHVGLDAAVPDESLPAIAAALRAVFMQQWVAILGDLVCMSITRMRVARVAGHDKMLTLHCNMRIEGSDSGVVLNEVWSLSDVFGGLPVARVGDAVAKALVSGSSLTVSRTPGALDAHVWEHGDLAAYLAAATA